MKFGLLESFLSFLLLSFTAIIVTIIYMISQSENCDNKNNVNYPIIPKEFEECVIGEINLSEYRTITVVKCPNSSVTAKYYVGKYTEETVTIDGSK